MLFCGDLTILLLGLAFHCFVIENRKSLCHSLGRPSRSDFVQLKFIYKGNKNVEALNIRTAEEIKVLKRNLESLKQDTSLEQAEKAAKMEKIEKNITNLQKKCKEQTDIWIKEQQEDEKRAKARFAAK